MGSNAPAYAPYSGLAYDGGSGVDAFELDVGGAVRLATMVMTEYVGIFIFNV